MDQKEGFYDKLRIFLSQPIEEIERLWKNKKTARKEMIRDYFSAYDANAGKRATKIIFREVFWHNLMHVVVITI
mgnify:CR=1 FL=1